MTDLTIEIIEQYRKNAKYDGLEAFGDVCTQLLATMQREAKLRDALEELHALYAETDRTLDATEVCGKVQELLYCSEYSKDAK